MDITTTPMISTIPENRQAWLELRSKVITSTEISALFGLSKYQTLFELWHTKKNQTVVSIEEAERMKWGNRLQAAIAKGIAEDEGLSIREMNEFMHDPYLRMGSSFDYSIEHDTDPGILEIKNVDSLTYKNEWTEDEAPAHIEAQLQYQLLISGRSWGMIGALVGGNTRVTIKRKYDPSVGEKFKIRVAEFWKSIEENRAPSPNFETDAEFISKLYNYAEPGKVVSADSLISQAVESYQQASEQIKHFTAVRDAAKAMILERMRDAEKVIGDTFTISAGIVGPAEISYTREGYRSFRVTKRKVK